MARSQETFNKKEKEKKRLKKRLDKQKKKEERRANSEGVSTSLDDMMAYVDELGNITDTPPDPTKKSKVNAKSIEIAVPKRKEIDPTLPRTGRVEFFNDSKGFGFIKELETQEKFFVHINGLMEEVREGDKVIFELERGMKGMNAVRVKKV